MKDGEPQDKCCEHDYVFHAQEEKNIGYDRDPIWLIQDVFYCRKCLDYARIDVRKEKQRNDSYGRRVVEQIR